MRPGKRLFVGVRTSVAAANTLAGCAETLGRRARDAQVDLRWVAPVNYHVTLAFLGWTGLEAIGRVRDALEAAIGEARSRGVGPLTTLPAGREASPVGSTAGESRSSFRTSRLGAFPSLDHASVLWAGIEWGTALTVLARSVGEAMADLGFPRDARPFHPHVTLARLRSPRAIREIVLPMAEQMFGDTRIDAVTLFESETKSSGSIYRDVCRIPFKSSENAPETAVRRQTGAVEQGDETQDTTDTDTDDGWPRGHQSN